jgi:C2 domain-containing protein 3
VDSRCEVNIAVDNVSFPLQNALFAGQKSLDPAAACYVRYKFYDRGTCDQQI